jgi:hypothetical protein
VIGQSLTRPGKYSFSKFNEVFEPRKRINSFDGATVVDVLDVEELAVVPVGSLFVPTSDVHLRFHRLFVVVSFNFQLTFSFFIVRFKSHLTLISELYLDTAFRLDVALAHVFPDAANSTLMNLQYWKRSW